MVIYVCYDESEQMQGELEECKVIPAEGTIRTESLRCKKAWHVEGVEKLSTSQCAGAWWGEGPVYNEVRETRKGHGMQGIVGGKWIWILNRCAKTVVIDSNI